MLDPLTAQEALIARMAAAGRSNPEIAAQPLLATADPAKNVVAIRVQLVKYIVHFLDGTVRPAGWGARRIDHST